MKQLRAAIDAAAKAKIKHEVTYRNSDLPRHIFETRYLHRRRSYVLVPEFFIAMYYMCCYYLENPSKF